ncbi:MAG TPA: hypothetical protein VFK35_03815 [Candidatus Limnocylindrales bacterium]|nr:hypothetical protein [Candidatus Limnocylindrales bacterium]
MKIEDVEGIGPASGLADGRRRRHDRRARCRAPELDPSDPGEATLAGWIEQARALGKIVRH